MRLLKWGALKVKSHDPVDSRPVAVRSIGRVFIDNAKREMLLFGQRIAAYYVAAKSDGHGERAENLAEE